MPVASPSGAPWNHGGGGSPRDATGKQAVHLSDLPASMKSISFYASLYPAIQEQQLLSSP